MRELDDVIRDGLADWADSIPVEAHGPGRARSARPGAAVLATAAAVVVAALGLAAVTSGGGAPGSGPAPAPLGSVPGSASPLPTPSATVVPDLPPPPSGPAADALRAQVLPVVTSGYDRWEWPSDRDTTPRQLVDSRLGALLADPASVVVAGIADDANLCAWSLQLLADAEDGRGTGEARRRVALHETGSESEPNPFLEAARTEDLVALREAVTTYRCDQLPLG